MIGFDLWKGVRVDGWVVNGFVGVMRGDGEEIQWVFVLLIAGL